MIRQPAEKHIEALLAGRRPRGFIANTVDLDLIRTAITLQGARADLAEPREEFMSELRDELSAARGLPPAMITVNRWRRLAVVSVAAAASLIGGTVAVTHAVDHGRTAPAVAGMNATVQGATLVDARHRVVGRINLYGGSPSWVFMNLVDPGHDGPVACELRAADGQILVTGAFQLAEGEGQWARTIELNPSRIRSARIITETGLTLASATFPQA